MLERPFVLPWVIAAAAAFALVTLCLFMTPDGRIGTWALAASALSAALTAAVALNAIPPDPLARYPRPPQASRRPPARCPPAALAAGERGDARQPQAAIAFFRFSSTLSRKPSVVSHF